MRLVWTQSGSYLLLLLSFLLFSVGNHFCNVFRHRLLVVVTLTVGVAPKDNVAAVVANVAVIKCLTTLRKQFLWRQTFLSIKQSFCKQRHKSRSRRSLSLPGSRGDLLDRLQSVWRAWIFYAPKRVNTGSRLDSPFDAALTRLLESRQRTVRLLPVR